MTGAAEGAVLTIRKLLAEARHFANLIEQGQCPSCHGLMAVVYDGSSGTEMWCETRGCDVSLHSTPDGDYRFSRCAPASWVGERAE